MKSCQKNEERQLAILFFGTPILKDGTPIDCDEAVHGFGIGTTESPQQFDHMALEPFVVDYFAKDGMEAVVCQTGHRTEKIESTSPKFKNHFRMVTCVAYTTNHWKSYALCEVYAVIAEFAENQKRTELFESNEAAMLAASLLKRNLEAAVAILPSPVRVELHNKEGKPVLNVKWMPVPQEARTVQ